MSSVVQLVNSTPVHGGLSDGYRRSQLGQPSGSVGQPPRFRGEKNTPGTDVKAPRILSSSARQNRGTNVTIPYARVVPADELCNKGRLSAGDVAFISRYPLGKSSQTIANHRQKHQVTTSASTAHADVSRLAGLDYINRALGPEHYDPGQTVLVDSVNPLDDWRSLGFLNEWTPDGIVMSADSPGYVLGASSGVRNDQVFNVGIQGPVQLNNGYIDDSGRGVASHYDRNREMAVGSNASSMIQSLIGGPFYQQYPLQMFDRKIRPMSDLYIGLVCRKIDGTELDDINKKTGGRFVNANHIHVFQYVCFSSRQVYQFATTGDDPDADPPDFAVVDTGRAARGDRTRAGVRNGVGDYNLGESEPADRRRGPNDPKRGRTDNHLPRKRASDPDDEYAKHDTFLGIKKKELKNMVGAWRIGKVLDVASKRLDSYMGGPIDTAFSVTLNFDLGFVDWRQLRRNFTMNIFGHELDIEDGTGTGDQLHWGNYNSSTEKFAGDFGRLMQWPTWYDLGDRTKNVPIDPKMKEEGNNYTTRFTWAPGKLPDDQVQTYLKTMDDLVAAGPGNQVLLGFVEQVGQSAAGALADVVAPPTATSAQAAVSAAQPAAVSAAQPAAQAPVQASSADPLGFPEQVEQPRSAVKASAKASGKAPAASVEPVRQPAAPKAASGKAAASKTPAVGAIGDDVMASIFGSSMPAAASAEPSVDLAREQERGDAESRSSAQPKQFPRRRGDR